MRSGLLLAAILLTTVPVPCILADDTTWTRVYAAGQGTMPARVRCHGEDIYVAGSVTMASTMQAFLLKYHGDGTQDWLAPVGYCYYSVATALAIAPDGAIVMGMDAGYGTPVAKVARYNVDGDTVWTRDFAAATMVGVGVANQGDVFCFGTKGDPVQDSVWVARLSAAGDVLWNRSYKLGAAHQAHGFGSDSVGTTMALMRVSAADGRPAGPTIMKFTPDGDTEWVKRYSNIPNPVSMSVAPSGNAFVLDASSVKKVRPDGSIAWSAGAPSGSLASDVGLDVVENVYIAYTDNQPDIRVRAYTAQGGSMRTLACVRPGQDQAMTVTTDAGRRPVVAGLTVESNMRQLTVKFMPVSGVDEERGEPARSLLGASVLADRWLRCTVRHHGAYRLNLRDASGRNAGPEAKLELVSGPNLVRLPALVPGVYFGSLAGEGYTICFRFVQLNQ